MTQSCFGLRLFLPSHHLILTLTTPRAVGLLSWCTRHLRFLCSTRSHCWRLLASAVSSRYTTSHSSRCKMTWQKGRKPKEVATSSDSQYFLRNFLRNGGVQLCQQLSVWRQPGAGGRVGVPRCSSWRPTLQRGGSKWVASLPARLGWSLVGGACRRGLGR